MDIYNELESYKVAVVGDIHLRLENPRCRIDNYLDSLLNKIENILQNCDIFICLGDLFDKPSVGDECLNKFLSLLAKYDKPFYTIWGNHDLYKYSIEKLDKTSLGICLLEGRVKHLDEIKVHNTKFKEIPFVKKFPKIPENDKDTILLGHCFYESEVDFDYSIKEIDLINVSSRFIYLGHEHSPFPKTSVYNTSIIRQGSLCRNSINSYNYRIPVYSIVECNKDDFNITFKEVITDSPENIFIKKIDLTNMLPKAENKLDISFDLIDENSYINNSVELVMKKLNASDKHLNYLKQVSELIET